MNVYRPLAVSAVFVLSIFGVACHKKVAATVPPAPVQAAAPAPSVAPRTTPAPAVRAPEAPPEVARSRYPDAATMKRVEELLARIQDVYFDYDKHLLRQDAQATLAEDAKTLSQILQQYPDYKLTVEGHADERGSAEYNMALGDARSRAAKEYLVGLGIPGIQLETVSYGKERPVCTEQTEACWQKNRRAHVIALNK